MSATLSSGFHLADRKSYMLGGGVAACRLNLQFFLWKQSLQFNVHPSIPMTAESSIADIATGTAIWLLDLACELPSSVRLHGYDIDLSNTPPPQWLPNNITLHTWNLFDPVPDHLVGKYDVIHLRLLILVVQDSDPVPVIRNVARMLKPGGYIQWDDLNYPDTHVYKAHADAETPAFDQLRRFVYSQGRHDWVLDLPRLLEENGFVDATLEHFRDRKDLAAANGEQHLATMQEFVGGLEQEGMMEDAESIRALLSEVYREATSGVALSMPRVVCVARKLTKN
jgi:SAM-dependent methyltransferase